MLLLLDHPELEWINSMNGLLCAFGVIVVIGQRQSICKQLTGKLLELAQDSWEVCCGGKREGFVKTAHTSGYLPCKACAAHSCTATPFTRPYAIAHSSEKRTPSNLCSLQETFCCLLYQPLFLSVPINR